MIFVTVGTHEQQFNRLIRKMDELKRDEEIKEEVFIQSGYSTYSPSTVNGKCSFPIKKCKRRLKSTYSNYSRGPSSFISVLQEGKIPVVVPRKAEYEEHINNHQAEFARMVYMRQKILF